MQNISTANKLLDVIFDLWSIDSIDQNRQKTIPKLTMACMIITLAVQLLILGWAPLVFTAEETVFAAVIYRHGERTPIDPYPNDPYGNSTFWSVPFGQLTNNGKWQHYNLGAWFRRRYSHLLSEKYIPSEIYVHSTDVDRTLMSAQANLAGLYPPENDQVWDTKLLWQPIPVHTVPKPLDALLSMEKPCPAITSELDNVNKSEYIKNFNRKYAKLYKYVTKNSGKQISDIVDASYLYDVLLIEELNNFDLPKWTSKIYPSPLNELHYEAFLLKTYTPRLARLMTGPLLKEITNLMKARQQILQPVKLASASSKSTANVVFYSAHDTTVANMLHAMGLYDREYPPPFTATLIFDLLKDTVSGEHRVRVSYRNSTEIVEPHILNISTCGICLLDEFIQHYNLLISVNWDKECFSNTLLSDYSFENILVMAPAVFLVCIFILFFVIFYRAQLMGHKTKVNNDTSVPNKFTWGIDSFCDFLPSQYSKSKYISVNNDLEEM